MSEATSACVLTTHYTDPGGYGHVRSGDKIYLHHRYVYKCKHRLTWKEMEGKVVRHLCNNPSCINLAHLVLGTQKDNMQDMMRAGRRRGGGHPPVALSTEQVQQVRSEKATHREIATKYKVSETVIWKVLNRKRPYE